MSRRYKWTAKFLHGNGHAVIFCDPRGALDLFRTRESFRGGKRAALLHWVRAHKRKIEESETEVRRHLRGVQSFVWNGWQVRLDPSPFDTETMARSARGGE